MPTELKLLAIDTATEACSVALNLRGVITQEFQLAPNGHSKLVLDMAHALLREAGLELSQLDALAVDVGPGSFTGVRIGIGVAQGLGYGAGLPVVAVHSLEALASDALDGMSDDMSDKTAVLAAIDARMGQVYCAVYDGAGDAPRALVQPALAAPDAPTVGDAREIIGVGNAWDRYGEVMLEASGGSVRKWLAGRHPEAGAVSRIAAARGLAGAVSPLELTAAYIRDEVARAS